MILYLCRHASAEEAAAGQPDADRALTREGIRKFRAAAEGFASLNPDVSRILTSPLLRARQTAEILAEAFAQRKVKLEIDITPALAPPADLAALLRQLRDTKAPAALAVGHEPSLSEFLGQLCFDSAGRCKLKKGAIAAIDLPANHRRGTLLALLQPAHLRGLS